jgi:hypothetical protein
MPKEYDRVTFRGKPTDYRTAVMARTVEKALGIAFYCYQGSYNPGGVGASGGTHDKGGVLDLNVPSGKDPNAITRQLRNAGFAAWYRTPAQGFTPHIHAVDIGNNRLAYNAGLQVGNYNSEGSGLWPLVAGNDPQQYRPTVATYYNFVTRAGFNFDNWREVQSLRQRISNRLDRIRELLRSQRKDKRKLDRLS